MILDGHKLLLIIAFGLLMCCNTTISEELVEVPLGSLEPLPETLAEEVQGHENASGRKVRQFGFPPPPPPFGFGGYPPPPPPFGFGGRPGFGGGPGFGGRPGYGGFGGGGFPRTRVVTRTRTRVVNRYGGGGFYG